VVLSLMLSSEGGDIEPVHRLTVGDARS